MSFFANMIEFMSQTDLVHLFFPWLLTVAITYGVLDKYDIFDDPSVNGAVALSVSFLGVGGVFFFAPEGIFINFGAALAFSAFVALGFMIVMAVAGIDLDKMSEDQKKLPLIGGLTILGLSLLIIGGSALGIPELIANLDWNSETNSLLMQIFMLAFIVATIYIASR